MHVISPATIDNTALSASNVPETDYDEWDVATAYTTGDYVMVTGTTHQTFQALQNSTGEQPVGDDADVYWNLIGATNRWKAFDNKISDQVSQANTITYTITPATRCTAIAFFGLSAENVQVVVKDTEAATIYDQTVDLVETDDIIDWYTFFTWAPAFDTEAVFTGVPAEAGYDVEITIDAGTGTAKVGQIVLGLDTELGETGVGTELSLLDFSRKDRDPFGNPIIIEREFADKVDFPFRFRNQDARRVKRVLSRHRATPAVFFPGPDMVAYGATIYGFIKDWNLSLGPGEVGFADIEIEGLT